MQPISCAGTAETKAGATSDMSNRIYWGLGELWHLKISPQQTPPGSRGRLPPYTRPDLQFELGGRGNAPIDIRKKHNSKLKIQMHSNIKLELRS